MNLAHKPPFLLLYHIHQSYFAAYIRLFNMSYDPTLGFAPLSPPPRMLKNTATQLRPAKSMPNLQHVRIPLGSPVHTVADDNTASHHSSHSSIIVPLISVTSPVDSSSLEHLPVEYCHRRPFAVTANISLPLQCHLIILLVQGNFLSGNYSHLVHSE